MPWAVLVSFKGHWGKRVGVSSPLTKALLHTGQVTHQDLDAPHLEVSLCCQFQPGNKPCSLTAEVEEG